MPKYYRVGHQNEIIPLDPVSQERLRPHSIPEGLRSDPELEKGFRFWKENAHRLRLRLLSSAHGDTDDLTAANFDLHTEAAELARHNGMLFLEGVATGEQQKRLQDRFNFFASLDEPQASQARKVLAESPGRGHFGMGALEQITGTGVTVAFPDYHSDSTKEASGALARWNAAQETIMADAEAGRRQPAEALDAWQSTSLGFTAYRNWYLIGKMGSYLADHDEKADTVIHAGLFVGSNHVTIGEDLAQMGATVEYKGYDESALDPTVKNFARSVGHATLTLDDRVAFVSSSLSRD